MRRTASTTALALLALAAPPAMAQQPSFQVEHFEPLPSQGTNLLNIGKSDMLGHLKPSGGVVVHYVDTPLRLVNEEDAGDVQADLIRAQAKTELWASFGFAGVAELGVVMPLVAYQRGDDLGAIGRPGEALGGAALGDARLVPKVRLPIAPEEMGGFGVGLVAPVYLPTGDEASFNSDGSVRVEPRLIVDWRHRSGAAIAANVGYQLRPEQALGNIVSDDMIRYGLGVELPMGIEGLSAFGALFGSRPTAGDGEVMGAPAENRSDPSELTGGLQWRLPFDLIASVGLGTGLTDGVGAPRYRVIASFGYTPEIEDVDRDGVLDVDDACRLDPEDHDNFEDHDGCPDLDNDQDTILDVEDECPDDPEDLDGFEDEDGCPDPDNDQDTVLDVDDECPDEPGLVERQGCPIRDRDGDGVEDHLDSCPDEPEDFDGFEDEDGCPDDDHDRDGIVNEQDRCPDEAETYNGFEDEDGCPDGERTVVVTETEIKIFQKVFFDFNKAIIKKRSYPLLDTVATVLRQHPKITRIRVEGHTDDVGTEEDNLDLSRRRAAAVRQYLIDRGIDPARIDSTGYGEVRPLCPDMEDLLDDRLANRSKLRRCDVEKIGCDELEQVLRDRNENREQIKACRATNRRVEFKILEVGGEKIEADTSVIIEEEKVIELPPDQSPDAAEVEEKRDAQPGR